MTSWEGVHVMCVYTSVLIQTTCVDFNKLSITTGSWQPG